MLDASNSKNVTDARRGSLGTGFTCVYGNFTPHDAVASVVYGVGEGTGGEAVAGITVDPTFTLSLCPSSGTGAPAIAMVSVRDLTSEKADPEDAGYDIVFN